MEYLFEDPIPYLSDTKLWSYLLGSISRLEDRKKAFFLMKRMWTFRSLGTMLRRNHHGVRFVPLTGAHFAWESAEEFEEIKTKYLGPIAADISALLEKLPDELWSSVVSYEKKAIGAAESENLSKNYASCPARAEGLDPPRSPQAAGHRYSDRQEKVSV